MPLAISPSEYVKMFLIGELEYLRLAVSFYISGAFNASHRAGIGTALLIWKKRNYVLLAWIWSHFDGIFLPR